MKLLLTREQESTLWHFQQRIMTTNGDIYLYSPYYLKDVGGGEYVRLRFDELPEEAKDMLLKTQGADLKINGKSDIENWVESLPGSTRVSDYLYKINYNDVECAVLITRTTMVDYADIRPVATTYDIGAGAGVSIRKEFKRN